MDAALIKNIGNWNPDTQEDRYSAKLPLQALRIMARHDRKKGLYYLPLSGVQPPEELAKLIFPFIEGQLEHYRGKNPTAVAYLKMLLRLRSVILQDAAQMKILGLDHMIFHLPVFCSGLFAEFCASVKNYLSTTVNPFEASIESVLPGIQSKIDSVHSDIGGQIHVLLGKIDSVKTRTEQTVTTAQLCHPTSGRIVQVRQFRWRIFVLLLSGCALRLYWVYV